MEGVRKRGGGPRREGRGPGPRREGRGPGPRREGLLVGPLVRLSGGGGACRGPLGGWVNLAAWGFGMGGRLWHSFLNWET